MAKHNIIKKSTIWLALLLATSTNAQTLPEGTLPTLPPFPEIPAKQPIGSVRLGDINTFAVGKNGSLYAFCMALPKAGETVKVYSLAKSEGQKVKSVELLGSKAKLKWKQTNECLTIECPQSLPCQTSIVFKID